MYLFLQSFNYSNSKFGLYGLCKGHNLKKPHNIHFPWYLSSFLCQTWMCSSCPKVLSTEFGQSHFDVLLFLDSNWNYRNNLHFHVFSNDNSWPWLTLIKVRHRVDANIIELFQILVNEVLQRFLPPLLNSTYTDRTSPSETSNF